MEENRYAPPKALVGDATQGSRTGPAPALWNPDAAASWCLLFSPVFGTWLHMRNWEALGEPERARKARRWFIAAVTLIVAAFLAPDGGRLRDLPIRLVLFLFLILWYFVAAKPQVAYVKANFGSEYPRKGWGLPILTAIGLMLASMAVMAVRMFMGVVA